jgi:hypothetical protein
MSRCLRIALLWLIALTLSLQGAAAASMLICMTQPAMQRVSTQLDRDTAQGARHDMRADAAERSQPRDDVCASGDCSSPMTTAQCASAAACHTATAMPAPSLQLPSATLAIARAPILPAVRVGFFTDGPDRPPRLLIA